MSTMTQVIEYLAEQKRFDLLEAVVREMQKQPIVNTPTHILPTYPIQPYQFPVVWC